MSFTKGRKVDGLPSAKDLVSRKERARRKARKTTRKTKALAVAHRRVILLTIAWAEQHEPKLRFVHLGGRLKERSK